MINGLLKQPQTYILSALYYVCLQLHAITCLYCTDELKKTIKEKVHLRNTDEYFPQHGRQLPPQHSFHLDVSPWLRSHQQCEPALPHRSSGRSDHLLITMHLALLCILPNADMISRSRSQFKGSCVSCSKARGALAGRKWKRYEFVMLFTVLSISDRDTVDAWWYPCIKNTY